MKAALLITLLSISCELIVSMKKCSPTNRQMELDSNTNSPVDDLTLFDRAYSKGEESQPEPKIGFIASHDVTRVTFWLHTPSGVTEIKFNPDRDKLLEPSGYNPSNPTKLIIHGWQQDRTSEVSIVIKDAYLRRYSQEPVNIIVIDWGPLAAGLYVDNIPNVKPVGKYVTDFIRALNRIQASKVHIIGFSLGAQIAGAIGMHLNQLSGSKIGRISGLDPAGPGYDYKSNADKLDGGDADFVDVIHTCVGKLGIREEVGTADFFVNGGSKQPGCNGLLDGITGKCDHETAPVFFAQSLTKTTNACHCQNWNAFVSQCKNSADCSQNSVRFGALCPTSARGTYYLQLNLD